MGLLYGALTIRDSERPFTDNNMIRLIWDHTQDILRRYNQETIDATRIFVQGDTQEYKERYELPGGGRMQREDEAEGSPTAEVKRTGSWDVAYGIKQYGDSMAWTDVSLAYLEMGQFEANVQTELNRNNSTIFYNILNALFNNAPAAFTDKIRGSLTVVPLANGDAVVYPQTFGSDVAAVENFYLAPNYSESGISNTNNPILAIINVVEPHFGTPTGGTHLVVLISTTALQYVKALSDFVANQYWNVEPGDQTAVPKDVNGISIPNGSRIAGTCDGATIVVWQRMPSGWMVGCLPGITAAPLKRRVDDEKSGLKPGLQLLPEERKHPYIIRRWRNRYGYNVGNRLGAVCVALNGTTSYTVPTIYQ